MRRFVVTGCSGQVGWELVRALQPWGEVIALGRNEIDLAQPAAVRKIVLDTGPTVIFNPAAYTAVDRAESDAAAARAVNCASVEAMADAATVTGSLIVHYSTDYVFDGESDRPYVEDDLPAPCSVYGRSKRDGELALAASRVDWLCLRTSWVFSSRGRNFLRTVLRLAREREELRVVDDQTGAPTWCRLVADASVLVVMQALRERDAGTFRSQLLHLTAGGAVSWHGFAEAIIDGARRLGMPGLVAKRVAPIPTAAYPTPACRPRNSRLDCSRIQARYGLHLPDWSSGLALCLSELASHEWT